MQLCLQCSDYRGVIFNGFYVYKGKIVTRDAGNSNMFSNIQVKNVNDTVIISQQQIIWQSDANEPNVLQPEQELINFSTEIGTFLNAYPTC